MPRGKRPSQKTLDDITTMLKEGKTIEEIKTLLKVGYPTIIRIQETLDIRAKEGRGRSRKNNLPSRPPSSEEILEAVIKAFEAEKENESLKEQLRRSENSKAIIKEELEACRTKLNKLDSLNMRLRLVQSGAGVISGD